jgi:hypothetical protein
MRRRGSALSGGRSPASRGSARSRVLACVVALALIDGGVGSARARAAEPAQDVRDEVEALYEEAAAAREDGDLVAAGAAFAAVLAVVDEAKDTHGSRALALADAVAAYRAAFEASAAASSLCEAQRVLLAYEAELTERYGDGAAAMDGGVLAAELGEGIAATLADNDLSCETGEPAPAGPSIPVIAGGVSLGVGGLLLAVMGAGLGVGARAEREALALRDDEPTLTVDDPELAEILERGRRGNRTAIVGGILGGAALIAGAVLIGISRGGGLRGAQARAGRRVGLARGGVVVRF